MLPFVLVLLLSLPVLGHAQSDTTDLPDTTGAVVMEEEGETGFVMSKSPALAVMWGIIPGGGQIYTEQYWKAPLFAVPVAALVGTGIYNHGLYSDYADQVRSIDPSTNRAAYDLARRQRELYRDRRDLSYAVGGIVFLLSLVDAYVGAHLYDFDVDDTLSSIYVFPDVERRGVGLGVRW